MTRLVDTNSADWVRLRRHIQSEIEDAKNHLEAGDWESVLVNRGKIRALEALVLSVVQQAPPPYTPPYTEDISLDP